MARGDATAGGNLGIAIASMFNANQQAAAQRAALEQQQREQKARETLYDEIEAIKSENLDPVSFGLRVKKAVTMKGFMPGQDAKDAIEAYSKQWELSAKERKEGTDKSAATIQSPQLEPVRTQIRAAVAPAVELAQGAAPSPSQLAPSADGVTPLSAIAPAQEKFLGEQRASVETPALAGVEALPGTEAKPSEIDELTKPSIEAAKTVGKTAYAKLADQAFAENDFTSAQKFAGLAGLPTESIKAYGEPKTKYSISGGFILDTNTGDYKRIVDAKGSKADSDIMGRPFSMVDPDTGEAYMYGLSRSRPGEVYKLGKAARNPRSEFELREEEQRHRVNLQQTELWIDKYQPKQDAITKTLANIHESARLIKEGKPITGGFAEAKLYALKALRSLGLDIAADQVRDTETLRAELRNAVAANLKATFPGAISNDERNFLEAALGNVGTDSAALPYVLDFLRRSTIRSAQKYNKEMDTFGYDIFKKMKINLEDYGVTDNKVDIPKYISPGVKSAESAVFGGE